MSKKFWEYGIASLLCLVFGLPVLYFTSVEYFEIKSIKLYSLKDRIYSYHEEEGYKFIMKFEGDTMPVYYFTDMVYKHADFNAISNAFAKEELVEIQFERLSNQVYGINSGKASILSRENAIAAYTSNVLMGVGLGGFLVFIGAILAILAIKVRNEADRVVQEATITQKEIRMNGKSLIWLLSFFPFIAVLLKIIESIIDHDLTFEEGLGTIVSKFEHPEWSMMHALAIFLLMLSEWLGNYLLKSNLNKIQNSVDQKAKIYRLNHGILLNLSVQSSAIQLFLVFLFFYPNVWLVATTVIYAILKMYYIFNVRSINLQKMDAIS